MYPELVQEIIKVESSLRPSDLLGDFCKFALYVIHT